MGTGLLASLLATFSWIMVHLFLMHQRPCKQRLAAMTQAFLLSLPLLFVLLFFLQRQPAIVLQLNGQEDFFLAYSYGFLLHLLFYFFFVEVFYHIERSVTLRFLIEIDNSSSTANLKQIIKEYSVEEMIPRRLNDMKISGWIFKKNDRWILTFKGLCLAKTMRFSCWLFQSKPQNERL